MKRTRFRSVLVLAGLVLGAARCSNWTSIKLTSPTISEEPACAAVAIPHHSSTSTAQTTSIRLCISEYKRNWGFDWSRVALRGIDSFSCVRVRTLGGNGLGYLNAEDSPDREDLELVPTGEAGVGGSTANDLRGKGVEFLLDDDADRQPDAGVPAAELSAAKAGAALGSALDNVRELDLELFTSECVDLCRTSVPTVAVRFVKGVTTPIIVDNGPGREACPIISSRAEPRDNDGGGPALAGAGTSAGGSNAGGSNAGGSNAGGSNAGGTAGAPNAGGGSAGVPGGGATGLAGNANGGTAGVPGAGGNGGGGSSGRAAGGGGAPGRARHAQGGGGNHP